MPTRKLFAQPDHSKIAALAWDLTIGMGLDVDSFPNSMSADVCRELQEKLGRELTERDKDALDQAIDECRMEAAFP